ncbi:MAG: hypothetical protein ACI4UE_00920 [Candidatus Scatovivens sp.]
MSKLTQKFISTLMLVIMMATMIMPLTVNAAQGDYSIKDMKLNTVIYFTGNTYSSIDYSCKRNAMGTYDEETAGIVWKINRLKKSIVIQLSDGKFRTIPVSQVTKIREEKLLKITVPSIEEAKDRQAKLNIKFSGENLKVDISNEAVAKVSTNGEISLGLEKGFSKLTITKGNEEPVELYIIKDASGNVTLDVDERKISAEAKAEILERITAGDKIELSVKDGEIVIANTAYIADAEEEKTYVEASGELSYDTKDSEADIMASAKVDVMDNEIINVDKVDTHAKKTIKLLIARIKSLF